MSEQDRTAWMKRVDDHEAYQREVIREIIASENDFPRNICFFGANGFYFGMREISLDGTITLTELKALVHAIETINADPRLKQEEAEFESYRRTLFPTPASG